MLPCSPQQLPRMQSPRTALPRKVLQGLTFFVLSGLTSSSCHFYPQCFPCPDLLAMYLLFWGLQSNYFLYLEHSMSSYPSKSHPHLLSVQVINCLCLTSELSSHPTHDKGSRPFKYFLLGQLAQCYTLSAEDTEEVEKGFTSWLQWLKSQAPAEQGASSCPAPAENRASLALGS